MKAYHNTNNLTGSSLDASEMKSSAQNAKVLRFMRRENKSYTPDEIWMTSGMYHAGVPLTSVRRSLSDLTRQCRHCGADLKYVNATSSDCCLKGEGILTKLKDKKKGTYGALVSHWILTEFLIHNQQHGTGKKD